MQRILVIFFCLSMPVLAVDNGLKELQQCDVKKLEEKVEHTLSGQDIQKIYNQENFDSFALKVLAPHLLTSKILFTKEYMVCRTLRDENLEAWEQCLMPRLEKAEEKWLKQLKQCLKNSKKSAKTLP